MKISSEIGYLSFIFILSMKSIYSLAFTFTKIVTQDKEKNNRKIKNEETN